MESRFHLPPHDTRTRTKTHMRLKLFTFSMCERGLLRRWGTVLPLSPFTAAAPKSYSSGSHTLTRTLASRIAVKIKSLLGRSYTLHLLLRGTVCGCDDAKQNFLSLQQSQRCEMGETTSYPSRTGMMSPGY